MSEEDAKKVVRSVLCCIDCDIINRNCSHCPNSRYNNLELISALRALTGKSESDNPYQE